MRAVCIGVVALLLASCSTPEKRVHDALMDGIEQAIRLPAGAKPLDAYVRYYAGPDGEEIAGVYILPGLDELPPGEGCDQLRVDSGVEPCTFGWPKSTRLGAGNRVWLGDYSELPMPMRETGDCGVVTVSYQTSERRFSDVRCFGQSVDY